jgi:hypothetical protein
MRVYRIGFPHSEISGSTVVCTSPELIAACRVLRRLPTPRHPPYALINLIQRRRCPLLLPCKLSKNDSGTVASSFLLGGDNRDRTGNLRLAKPALSQLSYIPEEAVSKNLVGLDRFELSTSRLSGVRSHQLSYRPRNLIDGSGKFQKRKTVACEGSPREICRPWSFLRRTPRRRTAVRSVTHRTLLRKEVIQPHLPIRLPCYDLVPLIKHTFGAFLPCGLGQRLRVHSTRLT